MLLYINKLKGKHAQYKCVSCWNYGKQRYINYSICATSNATYDGGTCRHLKIRVGEHSGVSPLTGKKLKAKTTTAIKDRMLFCDNAVSLDDFKVLAISN